jgi:DNA-binding transcriptional ArsR family regulator
VSAGPLRSPKDRHEWVRIVRRARLGSTTTFVAVMLATYGNRDGSSIFPGEQVLAAVTELSDRSVRSSLKRLREIGLVERVRSGNPRRGLADEYRLTIPVDLIEFVDMLGPDESPERGSGGGDGITGTSFRSSGSVRAPLLPETDDSTTGNSRQHHRKLTTAPPEPGSAHQPITTHVPTHPPDAAKVDDVTTDRVRANGKRP